MDITPMKEVQQENNKKLETLQKNNSLIIDLKLKVDRVNYLLTHMLDINNSNLFNGDVLISPEIYNTTQDLIIKTIGQLAPIVEKEYGKDK